MVGQLEDQYLSNIWTYVHRPPRRYLLARHRHRPDCVYSVKSYELERRTGRYVHAQFIIEYILTTDRAPDVRCYSVAKLQWSLLFPHVLYYTCMVALCLCVHVLYHLCVVSCSVNELMFLYELDPVCNCTCVCFISSVSELYLVQRLGDDVWLLANTATQTILKTSKFFYQKQRRHS